MTKDNQSTTAVLPDPDERVVEEVHCCYTNTPIPSIPSWYARVNVRFFSDAARAKHGPLLTPGVQDIAGVNGIGVKEDGIDPDADPSLDVDLDDIELDIEDDAEETEDSVEAEA